MEFRAWDLPWSVVDIMCDPPFGEEWLSLPQQGTIAKSFFVRGENMSPSQCLDFSILKLCRFYAFCHKCSKFICASVMLFLKDIVPWSQSSPLALTIFPHTLLNRSLNFGGSTLMKTTHLGLSAAKSLTLSTLSSGCLYQFPSTSRTVFDKEWT